MLKDELSFVSKMSYDFILNFLKIKLRFFEKDFFILLCLRMLKSMIDLTNSRYVMRASSLTPHTNDRSLQRKETFYIFRILSELLNLV